MKLKASMLTLLAIGLSFSVFAAPVSSSATYDEVKNKVKDKGIIALVQDSRGVNTVIIPVGSEPKKTSDAVAKLIDEASKAKVPAHINAKDLAGDMVDIITYFGDEKTGHLLQDETTTFVTKINDPNFGTDKSLSSVSFDFVKKEIAKNKDLVFAVKDNNGKGTFSLVFSPDTKKHQLDKVFSVTLKEAQNKSGKDFLEFTLKDSVTHAEVKKDIAIVNRDTGKFQTDKTQHVLNSVKDKE